MFKLILLFIITVSQFFLNDSILYFCAIFCFVAFYTYMSIWRKTSGGVHPIFIVLLTTITFLGGEIIVSVISFSFEKLKTPSLDFVLTNSSINTAISITSISIIFLSIGLKKIKYENIFEKSNLNDNGAYFWIYLSSMPFYLTKNISYMNYVSEYGYLALYTSASFKEDQNIFVRVISFLTPMSFLLYFKSKEKFDLQFRMATVLMILISIPVLLTGLRMQFMTFWVSIYFFWKIKKNDKFNLRNIVGLLAIISVLSMISELTRNGAEYTAGYNPILDFIWGQGFSINVIALTVMNYEQLQPRILYYLLNQIGFFFDENLLAGANNSLAAAITWIINSEAYYSGYSVGTSYLAESYLLLGYLGVALASYFLSKTLGWAFSRKYDERLGDYKFLLLFTFFQTAIFLPREGVFYPVYSIIKVLIYCLLIYGLVYIIKKIKFAMRNRVPRALA